jgi:hypothetical protein
MKMAITLAQVRMQTVHFGCQSKFIKQDGGIFSEAMEEEEEEYLEEGAAVAAGEVEGANKQGKTFLASIASHPKKLS